MVERANGGPSMRNRTTRILEKAREIGEFKAGVLTDLEADALEMLRQVLSISSGFGGPMFAGYLGAAPEMDIVLLEQVNGEIERREGEGVAGAGAEVAVLAGTLETEVEVARVA